MTKKRRYFNGLSELMILACLTKKSCYGYEMVDSINIHFGDKYKVSRNTIYTALYLLRDKNLIKEHNVTVGKKRERIYYTILPEGERCFEEYLKEYRACTDSVKNVLDDMTAFK